MSTSETSSVPSGEPTWPASTSLPPIAKKEENPLVGRVSKLDVAVSKTTPPHTETAKNVNNHIQQHAHQGTHPLFPPWASSLPKFSDHKISTSNPQAKECDRLKEDIQGYISDIIKGVDYNGLHVVTQFITFCEEQRKLDPNISNVEIFHKFQPDSKDEASLTYGSTCVGKARHIVEVLAEKNIEAHVVIQHVIVKSKGIDEPAGHAAVVVPGKDGILLIEVEHPVPILILKPNESIKDFSPGKGTREKPEPPDAAHPDLHLSMELIEVPGNYSSPTPIIVKKENFTSETAEKKNTYSEYILRPDTDPDLSVMKKWLVGKHTWFYPVSSAAREGLPQHSFQLNIAENKMTFNIGDKKFRIPLAAFDPTKRTIDRTKLVGDEGQELSEDQKDIILGKQKDKTLGGTFFDAFKTSKSLLLDQIFNVVTHREMLHDLRK